MKDTQQNIVIYKTKEGPELRVKLEKETLWLTLNQIALLFWSPKSRNFPAY